VLLLDVNETLFVPDRLGPARNAAIRGNIG
jgi:hypothetical protein